MDRGTVQTGSGTAAGGGVLPATPASPVASETHSVCLCGRVRAGVSGQAFLSAFKQCRVQAAAHLPLQLFVRPLCVPPSAARRCTRLFLLRRA